MTAGTETAQCACLPGAVCAPCQSRGYASGLAGYAARIYPQSVTPANEAREIGAHYVTPNHDDMAAHETCELCGIAVTLCGQWWLTIIGANGQCSGRLYAHQLALAGLCSHGGHGYDGETCSDIPV